jgi:hypothetical protein
MAASATSAVVAKPYETHRRVPVLPGWTVMAAATVAVVSRLPFLGRAPSPDEAGYLLVGAQWDGAGRSLYGSYWVDRPPLLVTIFRAASLLGGLPALRLIGCAAVLMIVLGSAHAAALLGGRSAGRWAAVAAAALCTSPLMGGYRVNGEMLAAPFVLGGMIAVIRAMRAPARGAAGRHALAAGAMAMCALLIKQNFADVAVFGAVPLTVSWVRGDITRRRFTSLMSRAALGAAAVLVVTAGWTVLHGTSLTAVLDAMYPFRVRAGQVLAADGSRHATARLHGLVSAAVTSGLAALVALALLDVATRRRRSALSWALFTLLVFAGASVLVGGSYWHHYLMGLVAPVAVTAGVLAGRRVLFVRPAIAYVAAAAAVSWCLCLGAAQGSVGQAVGTSIGAVSRPGDTIVNLYGRADIVETSGLPSPYPQLWSLPAKTLDPRLTALDAVLTGPTAPTWIVTGPSVRSWGLQTTATAGVIARDYRKVGTICGRTIYLHDGISRTPPDAGTSCHGTTSPLTPLKELRHGRRPARSADREGAVDAAE